MIWKGLPLRRKSRPPKRKLWVLAAASPEARDSVTSTVARRFLMIIGGLRVAGSVVSRRILAQFLTLAGTLCNLEHVKETGLTGRSKSAPPFAAAVAFAVAFVITFAVAASAFPSEDRNPVLLAYPGTIPPDVSFETVISSQPFPPVRY